MLQTITAHTHEHIPCPAIHLPTKLKPGGQCGNQNARKHGLYAAKNPHPHAVFLQHFDSVKQTKLSYQRTQDLSIIEAAIKENNLRTNATFQYLNQQPAASQEWHFLTRKLSRLTAKYLKLQVMDCEIKGRQTQLQNLVHNIHSLLIYEFKERGIPQYQLFTSAEELFFPVQKIFVSTKLRNFRANSHSKTVNPIFPTDDQWYFISEAIQILDEDAECRRKYKRHKPAHDPRLLMQAILIKLAFGIKWDKVPQMVSVLSPKAPPVPVRAAQTLYRDLFNKGLLPSIYEKLLQHLNCFGENSLEKLVLQACFHITGGKIVTLAPKETTTWEKLTALLFLQRAYNARKLIERERTAQRRARGQYLRLPSLRLKKPQLPKPPVFHPHPENPAPEFTPLEESPAAQKWKIIEKMNRMITEQTISLQSRQKKK